MDALDWYFVAIFSIICAYFLRRVWRREPPCPLALPIIGQLYLFNSYKTPMYRTLHTLSQKYGPFVFLHLGLRRVLLLSSASAIRACFVDHDVTFSNRPKTLAGELTGYNCTSVSWSQYGDHWRNLRRIFFLNMLSTSCIRQSGRVRNLELRKTLRDIFEAFGANRQEKTDLTEKIRIKYNIVITNLVQRIVSRMVDGNPSENLGKFLQPSALLTTLDYLPFLRWIRYGGIEKRLQYLHEGRDKFVQGIIDNYRRRMKCSDDPTTEEKTIVKALLSLQAAEPEVYKEDVLKGIIVMIFTAGMDTMVRLLEWTMALLLNHPKILEKATREIDSHVKLGELLDDSDVSKLTYLHCIICESLRLFPTVPLLVPHYSSEDCVVNGYKVPKNTTLLINLWAVHRDPDVWEDPDEFRPERFESGEAERDGYKFLPFGVGRRTCPGAALGYRLVGFVLGALVQCFDWERVGSELEDLTEGFGEVTLPKRKPLEAMYSPRPSMVPFLSQL